MRALNKAADEWTKLSTKKPDSWMYWFWQKGEHMMDKIEYEEWALKNIHEGRGVKIAKGEEKQEKIEVSLLWREWTGAVAGAQAASWTWILALHDLITGQ